MPPHCTPQLTFITIGTAGVIAIGIALFAGGNTGAASTAPSAHSVNARLIERHAPVARPGMKLTLDIRGDGTVHARGRRCASDCVLAFARGKPVALTPTADPGWMFADWAGYCDGTDLCRVDTVLRHAVTARFVPIQVHPTRSTPTPKAAGPSSVERAITARAACPGDTCKVWMRRERTVPAKVVHAPRTLTWSGLTCGTHDCSLDKTDAVTTLLPIQSRTLDVGSDGNGALVVGDKRCTGPARCTWQYGDAAPITLTAEPAAGFEFAGWDGCPEAIGDTCELRLTDDRTITAHFHDPATVEIGPS